MIIGVDMDCVLNNMDEVWVNRYNADYDDQLTIKDLTEWKIDRIVKPECGNKIYDYLYEPGFFRHLRPQPDAQRVLEQLSQDKNHEIYVITASEPQMMIDKIDWLSDYFPFIDPDRVMMVKHKWRVKVDVMIDDGIDYFGMHHDHWIVFHKAHNQTFRCCNQTTFRAYDWHDVETILHQIGQKYSKL